MIYYVVMSKIGLARLLFPQDQEHTKAIARRRLTKTDLTTRTRPKPITRSTAKS